MLKKQTQRKLALYFSAMIFLNGFLVWRSAHGIAIGLSDFASFYTAAEILHEGRGAQLYDLKLQEAVQRSLTPAGVNARGAILPYNHPAFEAYLFRPLAAVSYRTAYLIWLPINIGLLAAMIVILRKNLPFLGQAPLYLWAGACLAFTPITVALIQGQDSIVLLFCYAMAFIALWRKTDLGAGVWLGLGLFKFQLALPFIAPFVFLRRWRIMAGFGSVATLLLLISFGTTGLSELLNYPLYLWRLEHNPHFGWLEPSRMPNINGLGSSLFLSNHPRLAAVSLIAVCAILLWAATYTWRATVNGNLGSLCKAFAMAILISVLLSYHILLHDLSVVFLALILILESTASGLDFGLRSKIFILVCAAILWSPLSLILMQWHCFESLAIILLVLGGSILIQSRHFRAGLLPLQ